ncbi:MAG: tetratricopeptide repeat-containing glycosyltransferase [Christensenellales bacterium]
MSQYKVCVYTICKDESQFVDRWVDSMNEADLIVVCDTGSKDDIGEKLKARGVSVYRISVDPWRFDVARNISLSFVPDDFDICVCTDLDEVLEPGWREHLESAWTQGTSRLRYMYTWEFHEDGSRGATYWYEKIHGRNEYRWVHPVHEVLEYYGDKPEAVACVPKIQLNHFSDSKKSRGQYLPLLELSRKENPSDSSTAFWLGREYMFYGLYDRCIDTLKGHLLLLSAVWDQERCASMRYIARCYKAKGELNEAKKWLLRAIAECPSVREPYTDMAQLGYMLRNWQLVYLMVEEALKINEKPASYLCEDASWDYSLYDLGAIACYWIGLYERSQELATIAIEKKPGDERLKNNRVLIREKISAQGDSKKNG